MTSEEAAKVALEEIIHTFLDGFDTERIKIERSVLLSSKCYKIVIYLVQSHDSPHIITEEDDTGARSKSVWQDVIPLPHLSLVNSMKTPRRSAADTMFTVNGSIRPPVDLGCEFVQIVLGAVLILATKTIPGTVFIDKTFKKSKLERRQIVTILGQPVSMLTSFKDATIACDHHAEEKKVNDKVMFKVAKMTKIL